MMRWRNKLPQSTGEWVLVFLVALVALALLYWGSQTGLY